MIKKPLTQQVLADQIGVPQPTLNRWLTGEVAMPKADDFLRLAKALNVDPYSLLYGETPIPEPMLLREGPSADSIDDAVREMDGVKQQLQRLESAIRKIKSQSINSTPDAPR